jgi:hypothetical protein
MVLAGCSRERPLGSKPADSFPTANLSDQLILKQSGPLTDTAYVDTANDEIGIRIPDSLLKEYGPSAHLYVYYRWPGSCSGAHLEFRDRRTDTWWVLQETSGLGCVWGDVHRIAHDLGYWVENPIKTLLGTTHILAARGYFAYLQAMLAVENPRYTAFVVSKGTVVTDMAWTDRGLAVHLIATRPPGGKGDTLAWYNKLGERVAAYPWYRSSSNALLSSGSALWMYTGDSILMVDDRGQTIKGFRRRFPYEQVNRLTAVWVDGLIQIPIVYRTEPRPAPESIGLFRIDPWKSLDSGYTIYAQELPLSPEQFYHDPKVWDGTDLIARDIETGVYVRCNRDLEFVDSIPMPVNPWSMVWDGEALWIAHEKPADWGVSGGAESDVLLSRFYMR